MSSILIVEDHELLRRLLVGDVSRMRPDASVMSCGSVGEALRLLAAGPCDLVLLDLDLPDAKGFDGLRRIQEATSAAVTIVSASGWRRIKERARELGAASFVEKSGDIDRFYAALRKVLGVR
ncbi:MAG: response regulator [Burkholderiales bacterium]|jgi:DNA-binding response OmpR family regulator|nr:response regulator [Burkholderiales bacterium]